MKNKIDDSLPTEKDIENYLLLKDLLKAQRHDSHLPFASATLISSGQ